MSQKSDTRVDGAARGRAAGWWRRICADLESRGVSPEFSQPVAERLAPTLSRLSPEQYAEVLDGVAVAYGVRSEDRDALSSGAREIEEIQRLMRGFASELRKLEEGLRILSAYAVRMRSQATRDGGGTLH